MPQRIEFDGQIHEFPDDFTDADIAAALGGSAPQPASPPPPTDRVGTAASKATGLSADNSRVIGRLGERVRGLSGVPGIIMGAASHAADTGAQLGDMALGVIDAVMPGEMFRPYQTGAVSRGHAPTNEYQQLGQRAAQGVELAGVGKAATKVPGVVARGLGISKARAGANMDAALTAAKDARVATTNVQPGITRAKELHAAGGQRSTVLWKLESAIKKATDGTLSPREAQDFVSNASRMSANEFNALAPPMQRQVAEVATALRQAIAEAAETVGRGDQYMSGVREYARASKASKVGKRAAQASGALYIGDHILRRITGAIRESGARTGR